MKQHKSHKKTRAHVPQEVSGPISVHEERNTPLAYRHLASSLLLAVWFGLLTGLGEVAVLVVKKIFLLQDLQLGLDFVWMVPFADLFYFVIAGFFLSLTAWIQPRLISLHTATFVFAFLSFFSLLFMFHPQLYKYAGMLLAVGLATQSSRLIIAHAQGFYSFVRRSIGWMVVLIVGLAVGVYGWQGLAERRTLAKLPPASPGAPNVLLIVLDTVRAQNLSLYDYSRPTTPQLERLATTGVLFERAISTAPWTLPSHASMFTGRFPYELSTDWLIPLDATYPTLAEVLSMQGYITAGFVANTGYCSYEYGLNRGFAHYEDYAISIGQVAISSSLGRYILNSRRLRHLIGYHQILGRKTAAKVNSDFMHWLSRHNERPFFVFLNYYDAHAPYLPPSPFDLKFGPNKPGEWKPLVHRDEVTAQEHEAMIDGYDGAIAYLDYHLGLLFDILEKQGLLKNTLIIVTSDHGEEFGEHDVFDHGNSLYLPSVHVPLLISFPSRVPAGKKVRTPVTLSNLPATVLDLLNLEDKSPFPGYSLKRHWEGLYNPHGPAQERLLSEVNHAKNVPNWLPVSKGDMKALITDEWRYIENGDGRPELYHFESDPAEKHDRAGSEDGRWALEWFKTKLEQFLTHQDR